MLSALNRKNIFLLFFIFLTCQGFSQRTSRSLLKELNSGQAQDSLNLVSNELNALENKKTVKNYDSLRLELINKKALFYIRISKDTALYYAKTALTEARSFNLKNLTAVSLYHIALTHEYYKEFLIAEKAYLEWKEVRKNQSDDEYRWVLSEMRKFYSMTRQEQKLENNEQEWLAVLDRQLDKKDVAPWYESEEATPEESYVASMDPVLRYLVGQEYFFIAEKSLLHAIEKCPKLYEDWETAHYVYAQSELRILQNRDTATLSQWYKHWFNSLEKYDAGKKISLQTFNLCAWKFTSGYFEYDAYFDKYYIFMMNQVSKLGGNDAVHTMLQKSSKEYISSSLVRIKVRTFLIISSIRVQDKTTMQKAYTQADKIIEAYLLSNKSKSVLSEFLTTVKDLSGDSQFKQWCNEKIKRLE